VKGAPGSSVDRNGGGSAAGDAPSVTVAMCSRGLRAPVRVLGVTSPGPRICGVVLSATRDTCGSCNAGMPLALPRHYAGRSQKGRSPPAEGGCRGRVAAAGARARALRPRGRCACRRYRGARAGRREPRHAPLPFRR
jgi:hypothetical protein